MYATAQGFGDLRIDRTAKSHKASERRLNMAARAAEPIIKIKMTERGIEIVAPHQTDDTPTEPDTFRIACRAVESLCGFDKLVSLALTLFGGVSSARLRRLILSL